MIEIEEAELKRLDEVIERVQALGREDPEILAKEIRFRLERFVECNNKLRTTYDALPEGMSDGDRDHTHRETQFRIQALYGIPYGVYGLDGVEEIEEDWLTIIDPLATDWAFGRCTHRECVELFDEMDESHDLDPFYFLYGIPAGELSRLAVRYLRTFIFEFGSRNRE